jgi:hypothetical protein
MPAVSAEDDIRLLHGLFPFGTTEIGFGNGAGARPAQKYKDCTWVHPETGATSRDRISDGAVVAARRLFDALGQGEGADWYDPFGEPGAGGRTVWRDEAAMALVVEHHGAPCQCTSHA